MTAITHPLVIEIADLYSREPDNESALFAPPASDKEIEEFTAEVKLELSHCFYDFYRWHNGSAHDQTCFGVDRETHILSLDEIKKTKDHWDNLQRDGVFNMWKDGVWWNESWAPFLQKTDWHLTVIDTKGCFGGQRGQIISFDLKSPNDRMISYASFEKWLETVILLKKQDLLAESKRALEQMRFIKQREELIEQTNRDSRIPIQMAKYRR